MKQPSQKQTKFSHRAILAALFSGLAITAVADQITVRKALDVLSDKNPFADPVESVASDAKLERLATDGSWFKVRTASGKEGYITSDDVDSPARLVGVAASDQAGAAIATNANRGLYDDSRLFAEQKNLRLDGYHAMISMGNSVSRDDVRKFGKEGHVGPAKYRNK